MKFNTPICAGSPSRWDYRIIIVRPRKTHLRQSESEIAKQLFPDQEAFTREENRRWELTTNHWDLPIHVDLLCALHAQDLS